MSTEAMFGVYMQWSGNKIEELKTYFKNKVLTGPLIFWAGKNELWESILNVVYNLINQYRMILLFLTPNGIHSICRN
jgi:hypothetical protein